jgi:hypothetical protein
MAQSTILTQTTMSFNGVTMKVKTYLPVHMSEVDYIQILTIHVLETDTLPL